MSVLPNKPPSLQNPTKKEYCTVDSNGKTATPSHSEYRYDSSCDISEDLKLLSGCWRRSFSHTKVASTMTRMTATSLSSNNNHSNTPSRKPLGVLHSNKTPPRGTTPHKVSTF